MVVIKKSNLGGNKCDLGTKTTESPEGAGQEAGGIGFGHIFGLVGPLGGLALLGFKTLIQAGARKTFFYILMPGAPFHPQYGTR